MVKILDILTNEFTTVICEPCEKISKKLRITSSMGTIETDNFFISYSKPCFSSNKTMFINFKGLVDLGMNSRLEFI